MTFYVIVFQKGFILYKNDMGIAMGIVYMNIPMR